MFYFRENHISAYYEGRALQVLSFTEALSCAVVVASVADK